MRAGHFFPDGMRRKFNVLLAKETGHFQEIKLAQSDGFLAVRTGNFLPQVARIKPDVHSAGGTGHFEELGRFRSSAIQPEPDHRRITSQQ